MLIFQWFAEKCSGERVVIERPAPSLGTKMKMPPDSGRTENEGIQKNPLKNGFSGLASSFSLSEKRPRNGEARRA
jgi:hypothetical protein